MLIYILVILISSANCDNLHKGYQSSLDEDGQLSESAMDDGVEIDPTFKGSSNNSELYSSNPGCPSANNGPPWVLYGSPPKCYITGVQGPCHHSTKMTYHSSTQNGTCECDCMEDDPADRLDPFCQRPTGNGIDRPHTLFYDTEECYPLFSQGPCRFDEWFVMDSNVTKGICEKRRCPREKKTEDFIFYSSEMQSCGMYGEICKTEKSDKGQDKDFYYSVSDRDWEPKCIHEGPIPILLPPTPPPFSHSLVRDLSPFECADGETYSKFLGNCVKNVEPAKSVG